MTPHAHYESLFVARQPVLDAKRATWGYFHYYRRCLGHTYSEFTDPLLATLSVIQCLPACMDTCSMPHKALIHLPVQALLTGIPKALGPGCVIPVLHDDINVNAELVAALKSLRAGGYSMALDLSRQEMPSGVLLELVDTVILDMRAPEHDDKRLAERARVLKAGGHALLAKRVETHEAAELARGMGFDFFAGHFFREPETLTQRKISAAESTRLSLLELLTRPEPDTERLVVAIEADASVSYRVLTMLNSAYFGLLKKVSSVRQAVLRAGWEQLSAWLRVMVLGDATPSSKARELLHLSAQRAKFLELLAIASDHRYKAESLFLLGLFSLLPAMFDMPMRDILAKLSLADDLHAALCGEPGPHRAWLDLTHSIEDTRWDDMAQYALELKLPTGSVAEAYNASFQWADKLVAALPNGKNNGHGGPANSHPA
jgi:EAL and modified HD-GYP domain-containing signal transduction protein